MKIGNSNRRVRAELSQRFSIFARNTNGLKHILGSRSTAVKCLWAAVLAGLGVCLGALLASALGAGAGAALSYTPDLRFLHWTTTFPAVTVCEMFNPAPVHRKFTAHYGDLVKNLSFNHVRYLANLLYGRGSCSKDFCVPCGTTVPCQVPWRQIIEHIHESCEELLSSCAFNGAAFPCCARFRAVDSEQGPCYSFNTLQHMNSTQESLMTVNRTTGPGLLSFRVHNDSYISVHSPEELSTNNLDIKSKFEVRVGQRKSAEFLFSLAEIENDPLLRFEEILVRGCRYLDEVPSAPFHTYPVYSYGACKLAQSTEDSFQACRCVHPARDPSYKESYCNYTGINCLVAYEDNKIKYGVDHKKNYEKCLPSCIESDLTTINIAKTPVAEGSEGGSLVNIRMSSLPHLRYERHLLRSNLDLVVSVGGVIGLFFGASILSMAEVIYLILRNPH